MCKLYGEGRVECVCVCLCVQEMIALVRERLVEILHTKEGAKATMRCIWHGRPKVRGWGQEQPHTRKGC